MYYINYVARSIHPSNGHAFLVQRASFFTGVPEHPTPSKIRRVTASATTTRAQAEAEQQHSEEEIQFTALSLKVYPLPPELQGLPQVLEVPMIDMHQ